MSAIRIFYEHALEAARAHADAGVADMHARRELALHAPVQPGGVMEFTRRGKTRRIRVKQVFVSYDERRGMLWHYSGKLIRVDGTDGKMSETCSLPIELGE